MTCLFSGRINRKSDHMSPFVFQYRRATEQDAEAIAMLSSELGYTVDSIMIQSRIKAIRESKSDLLIAAVDSCDVVIGWMQAHAARVLESGFRVEITGLIVSRAFRRHGIGRALVAKAERWAAGMGADAIVVRSNAKREESHSFYPALGYTCTKSQMVYRKPLPILQ